MPFGAIAGAVGAGVVGSLASSAVGALTSGASGAAQSSDISAGLEQANKLLSPYAETGTQASNQLADLDGLNGNDAATKAMDTFQSSPSYTYNVQQGLDAVDQGAASRGMLQSGGTIRAEQTLGSNLANENFQQYYQNIAGLAGNGLTAATSEAGTDTSAAASQASIAASTAKGVGTSVQSGISNLTQNALSGVGSTSNPFGSASGDIDSSFGGF